MSVTRLIHLDSSEYIAPCDARRAYLTSFTGSAGTAVITQTKALCWTDGRYFLQAEKQLGEGLVPSFAIAVSQG